MRRLIGAVVWAAGTFSVLSAFAEDEEIVVTATGAPTSLERLPARIDVIDRAEFEAKGISTLPEAIGAEAVQSGGIGQQTSVFLRGANSSHTLALFDGVRMNDASNPTGQYDFGQDTLGALTRVEILRGPASAIYGSDAIGGVVNLIPRRGGDTAFEPFLEASTGSLETRRFLLGAAGTLGAIEYGFSADGLETEGYDLVPARMATHTGDADGARVATGVASASLDLGGLRFDALARVRDASASYDTFSGGPFFDLRADDPDLENEADQSLWRLGAHGEAGSMLTLGISGGLVRSDRAEFDGGSVANAAASTRNFADANVRYEVAGAATTVGLSYERDAIDTAPQFASPLSADERHGAAFIVSQFDVGERTIVTASARLDDYESFGVDETYSAGVVLNLAAVRLYGSTGAGFKAPSLSERYEVSFFNVGNPDLRPERSRSWEVGADWNMSEGLRLSAAVYQTRIEDLITYDFPQLRNINVGRADIDGAELRVEAAPTSWATLRFAYDWTDARDGDTGARLARRPEHAWRFDARLTPTQRSAVALSWASVGERADITYDDAGGFLSAAGTVSGFGVGAVSATYDLGANAQAFVRVDNITDEIYEQPAAFAGAPRTTMIGVRAHS